MKKDLNNLDKETVAGFGDEWSRLDQSGMADEDARKLFENYFSIFPWNKISKESAGFDLGCGSGRWAVFVASHVGRLHCIDPSGAIKIAKRNLRFHQNCEFHQAGVDDMPIADRTMDFGYSLGVLHHIPDTISALKECVKKLKPGAPFLLYLYYSFDNRPRWFKYIWICSEYIRAIVSRLDFGKRYFVSQIIAAFIYYPWARTARFAELLGLNVHNLPLAQYRKLGFYVMRTDALDRFGTRLEQRFSREEIYCMMEASGLENISFSDSPPYWCAIGFAKQRNSHDRL